MRTEQSLSDHSAGTPATAQTLNGAATVLPGPMKIIDLTRPLGADTPVYEGDPPVTVAPVRTHEVDGYQVSRVCMGSHSGTHIDAPRHLFADGATLDCYPVERLIGPGVIMDVRMPRTREQKRSCPGLVSAAFLYKRLEETSVLADAFILLWTEGAFLTAEAARVLVETKARLVGTDADSLDPPPSEMAVPERPTTISTLYPAHMLLLGSGILVAENLCNLDKLGAGMVTCVFLPLAMTGTDGAPVRAIAWR